MACIFYQGVSAFFLLLVCMAKGINLSPLTSSQLFQIVVFFFSGHDCSIRLWNLDSKTCVQEITSHRKKFEESIHDVAFHPQKPYIASAGADALAKVFV